MQKVFVDTNIVLDLLQKRAPFYVDAQQLFTLADNRQIELYISALTIANTHYILTRHYNSVESKKILSTFKVLVNVLPTDDKIIELALASDFKDFEDAIQFYTAIEHHIPIIITRNQKDFKNPILLVMSAKQFLTER